MSSFVWGAIGFMMVFAVILGGIIFISSSFSEDLAQKCLDSGGKVEYLGNHKTSAMCGKTPCTISHYRYVCHNKDGTVSEEWDGANPN